MRYATSPKLYLLALVALPAILGIECGPESGFPCSEQGIRDAIEAGGGPCIPSAELGYKMALSSSDGLHLA
jgi:hypothetical protein